MGTWKLKEREEFVKGPGYAEQTIFNSLKPGEEVLYGAASRNVCQAVCSRYMRPWSLRLGGPVFRGFDDKTAWRMFWRTWRY